MRSISMACAGRFLNYRIMTYEQQYKVSQVRDSLDAAREILDELMYGVQSVSKSEYTKLRDAYDLVCKANDTMP